MIIEKPWGKEEIIEKNDKYMLKKLTMFEGKRCSLQYHNYKTETIYIISGKLRIYWGFFKFTLISKTYVQGEFLTINHGIIHRMEAVEDCVYLETSTPEIDDIVRLEDDYSRK